MTQKEKELVLKAIHQIHSDDGDYYEGIHLLCELIGLQSPYVLMDKIQQVSLDKIKISAESDFAVE
jgi:hypothetical protein